MDATESLWNLIVLETTDPEQYVETEETIYVDGLTNENEATSNAD